MRPFCLILFPLEVVFVFTERITRIQQGVVRERDGGWITDSKVNTCGLLAGRLWADFLLTDDV